MPAHTPLNRQETLYLPRLEARLGTNDLVAGNPHPLSDDGMSGRALAGQAQRLAGLPPDRQYFVVSLALPATHAHGSNFALRLRCNRILTISASSSPSKMGRIASGGRQGVGAGAMEAHRLPSPTARDSRKCCTRNDMDGKRPVRSPSSTIQGASRRRAARGRHQRRSASVRFRHCGLDAGAETQADGGGLAGGMVLASRQNPWPCSVIGSKPSALTPLPLMIAPLV